MRATGVLLCEKKDFGAAQGNQCRHRTQVTADNGRDGEHGEHWGDGGQGGDTADAVVSRYRETGTTGSLIRCRVRV